MNKYEKACAELHKIMCSTCIGSGKCNDAEPGDISFREWVCNACGGTGMNPNEETKNVKN